VGPYGEAAWAYRAAGWAGVLPLPPHAKTAPPGGYTGWAGLEPSGADVQTWVDGPQGDGNIALRLPSGVYGLDVDDYDGKTGAAALGRLVEACGPLPATWIVSSRDASASGIRMFRAELPPGRRWRNEPAGHGAGIESIHRGHRYAVTWPSVHPEGRKYVWRRPDGMAAADGELPTPGGLPELPATWIEALSEPGEIRTGDMAGHDETLTRVSAWREGEACPRVHSAHDRAMGGLSAAAAGAALHPAAVGAIHELTNLGHEGHVGVRRALAEHYAAFVEVRAGRGSTGDARGLAAGEWWRMVRGAIGKLPQATGREICDCELWAGTGLLFDPTDLGGPMPGQDAGQPGLEALDLADALIGRMLTPAQLRDRPPPDWLIEGLLSVDSASWMIAAPSSYKSFVALDFAGHVAAGREWMGRAVTQGSVVYVVAEGVGGMGPRIRAWEQRNGPMPAEVRFLPMPVQIGRAEHWAALVEACRRLSPALIILDTQARITVGLDENDNTAMGEVVEAIELLRRSCGACVLTVHHTGRSGGHARGASAIDGAQDTELKLTRTGDLRVVLEIDKSKNAADDLRVDLELFLCELDGGGTSLVVGAPLSAAGVAPWRDGLTENQAAIMDILVEHFSERGATKSEIATVLRERGQRGESRYAKSSFYLALDALLKKDRIVPVHGTQRFVAAGVES
jgi:hypothetical protein